MSRWRVSIERYGLWYALGVMLFTRIVVMAVALTAPQHRGPRGDPPKWWAGVPTIAWDAGHYCEIAENGYPARPNDTVAFFPAYPLFCRPAMSLFRAFMPNRPQLANELAMVVVAHLAALAAVPFIYGWARRKHGAVAALLCVMLISVYPPALCFSSAYADSLLLLCVGAILCLLDSGRIWPAALVCAVASATRPTGLALALVVAMWSLREDSCFRHWWVARRLMRASAVGLVSISGFLAFQFHLWQHYGRPDAFVSVQSNWGDRSRENRLFRMLTMKEVIQPAVRPIKYAGRGMGALMVWPFRGFAEGDLQRARSQLARLLEPDTWNRFFNFGILVLAIVGLIRPGQIPRLLFLIPVFVFLMAFLADPARGGRLVGIARYQLIAVPCFLLLARSAWLQKSRVVLPMLVGGLLYLQCVYMRAFVDWVTVG